MTVTPQHALRVVEQIWIEAPPERVFRAFTDPVELMAWWSIPDQYRVTEAEADVRVGGHYRLAGPSGATGHFEVHGTYELVDPPRRLVYTWIPDWDDDAVGSRVELLFEAGEGGTLLRVAHTGFLSAASRDGHAGGWPEVLEALRTHASSR